MTGPTISIITAVYNGATTLQKTIDSVGNQSWPDKEHIIIDGGSTDETPDILNKNDSRIAYWESKPDRGIYHAWNKGIRLAIGEWILFLSSGDIFFNDEVLKTFVSMIRSVERLPLLAYGEVIIVDNSGKAIKKLGDTWNNSVKKITKGMPIPHTGCFHHRKLFQRFGTFDETFNVAGDYDLILRTYKESPPVHLTDFIVTKMLTGGVSGNPSTYYKVLVENYKAQRKNRINPFPLILFWRIIKHYVKHLYY
jgi:glycosyltransferase involved in cell wall biosynthesis